MQTIIHVYNFDVRKPDEKAAYEALCAKLQNVRPRWMKTWGNGPGHYEFVKDLDGQVIELETDHLFDNQWNTAPNAVSEKGLRVFDWAEDYMIHGSHDVHRGHWLEQTADMQAIRDNTCKCRYCGRQEPAAKGYVFCPHCIGSEYLTEKDLFLTRMMYVSNRSDPAPLTAVERALLLPLFKEAQLHGHTERDKARIAKKRKDVADKFAKAVSDATNERDGFTWLMDHGVKLDNVIYYNHTGRFGFGWRKPLDGDVLSGLLDIISEFSWPYEIKTADGRTLEGNIG